MVSSAGLPSVMVGFTPAIFSAQASSFAYRLDLGVPIDGSGFSVTLSGGTGQAVPRTNREDLQFDSTVGNLYNQP